MGGDLTDSFGRKLYSQHQAPVANDAQYGAPEPVTSSAICRPFCPSPHGLTLFRPVRGRFHQRPEGCSFLPCRTTYKGLYIYIYIYYFRHDPWDCHICRSVGVTWGVNVGIYGSPMECLGTVSHLNWMVLALTMKHETRGVRC